MNSKHLTDYEYQTASPYIVQRETTHARRLYAAGNFRAAAKRCRRAFLLSQAVREKETKAYAEKMAVVLGDMEQINELVKEVKRELTNQNP